MKKIIYIILVLAANYTAQSQTFNFENIVLDSGKVINGKDGETEIPIPSGSMLHLPTYWDTSFGGFWSMGWAASKKIDSASIVSNYSRHLYCAKPGLGASGSNTFIVGQNFASLHINKMPTYFIESLKISNSTYAANSMMFGDNFAKKFGGTSGNDSDYFFCRIMSYRLGELLDSTDIYLADFRSSANSNDFILDSWQTVSLPNIPDSLVFILYSSDNSSWGMNTPGFFVIDDVEIGVSENIKKMNEIHAKIMPNPARDMVHIVCDGSISSWKILGINGSKISEGKVQNYNHLNFSVANFPAGIYTIELETAKGISREKLMVQHP